MVLKCRKSGSSGFSLIQVGILLTAASLVAVAMLPAYQTKLTSNKNSENKLNSVMVALRNFEISNGRLPCPADAGQTLSSAYYGMEAANQGANCTGGTPAANLSDSSNNVAIGMVPVRTLGLSNDAALDDYGRYITYAADTTATTCWSASGSAGNIIIDDPDYSPSHGTPFTKTSVAALVSHGADGYGAFLPAVTNGTANRLNSGSTDPDQGVNAHIASGTFNLNTITLMPDSNSVNTTFVSKKPTGSFDDMVVYGNKAWNINAIPVSWATALTTTAITSVSAYPANGTYPAAGATLNFTLTFSSPVTVTGTPQLALQAITNSTNLPTTVHVGTLQNSGIYNGQYVGFATYQSGTGTNQLTFSYTININTDLAPIGITLASPINMSNSGAMITPCYTSFTPPNLSQVLIVPSTYIYIADQVNNRIVSYNMTTGAYYKQWPSAYLASPPAITMDSSGNFWLAGYDNGSGYDVEEITQAGVSTAYCKNNLTNTPVAGKCYGVYGIAFDPDNQHIWLFNVGWNGVPYLEWCDTTQAPANWTTGSNCKLATISTAFSANIGNIAVDGNGIVWTTDENKNNVRAFRSFNATTNAGKEITTGGLPLNVDGGNGKGWLSGITFDTSLLISTNLSSLWVTDPNPSSPVNGSIENFAVTYSGSNSNGSPNYNATIVSVNSTPLAHGSNLVTGNSPFGIGIGTVGGTNYVWTTDILTGSPDPAGILYRCPATSTTVSPCTAFNNNTGDPKGKMDQEWGIYIVPATR